MGGLVLLLGRVPSVAGGGLAEFCLARLPSLPALISFSPTLGALARRPWLSFRWAGILDPAPAEDGRANREGLDILSWSFRVSTKPLWSVLGVLLLFRSLRAPRRARVQTCGGDRLVITQ